MSTERTKIDKIELTHALRATYNVTNETQMTVVGSRSILGNIGNPTPKAPHLMLSKDVDVVFEEHPDNYNAVGVLGECSDYHNTFGYYIDGVDPNNLRLPKNWKDRAIFEPEYDILDENHTKIKVWFLSIEDLIVCKLFAHRPDDLNFLTDLIRYYDYDHQKILDIMLEMDYSNEEYQESFNLLEQLIQK